MTLAKLDMYDYDILPGKIQVTLSRTNDPALVDIMTDIHNSENRIYVDGQHFVYDGKYEVIKDNTGVYLELDVTQIITA
jgi:hypothetical protein